VEGTVHWFDLVLLILHVHLVEHIRSVEIIMTRCLPQIQVRDVWCVDNIVPTLLVSILPEVFNELANLGTLGMPKDKTTTGIFLSRHGVMKMLASAIV
jgi:hypothetical protein